MLPGVSFVVGYLVRLSGGDVPGDRQIDFFDIGDGGCRDGVCFLLRLKVD